MDLEARGAYMIKPLPDAYNENEAFILVKPLADGDLAIGILISVIHRGNCLWNSGIWVFHMSPEYPCLCMTASQGKNWANLPSDLHRLYHPMAVRVVRARIVEK